MIDEATGYEDVVLGEQMEYLSRFMLFVKDVVWARLPDDVRGEMFDEQND